MSSAKHEVNLSKQEREYLFKAITYGLGAYFIKHPNDDVDNREIVKKVCYAFFNKEPNLDTLLDLSGKLSPIVIDKGVKGVEYYLRYWE